MRYPQLKQHQKDAVIFNQGYYTPPPYYLSNIEHSKTWAESPSFDSPFYISPNFFLSILDKYFFCGSPLLKVKCLNHYLYVALIAFLMDNIGRITSI